MRLNREIIGRNLVRFNRGKVHWALINSMMILFLLVRDFDFQKTIGISSTVVAVALLPFFVFGMWLIGYLDEKHGFFKMEMKHGSSINPVLGKIRDDVDYIRRNLDGKTREGISK